MKFFLTLILSLFLSSGFCASTTSLKERMVKGKPGDYIVTSQGSNYSVLAIRENIGNRFVLEEITVPQATFNAEKTTWKEWVARRAPGHTSWMGYSFDMENNTLRQCYSYSQRQWIFIEKSDHLLAQILTINLRPTPDRERKRIGPPPFAGEADRRKLWLPQMIANGKKVARPRYDIVRATWPKDKTRLAGCVVELYFDSRRTEFPFPYWLEVQSPHYTFKMRAIDSGEGLQSPMPLLLE
jgi:hypothetical protein